MRPDYVDAKSGRVDTLSRIPFLRCRKRHTLPTLREGAAHPESATLAKKAVAQGAAA